VKNSITIDLKKFNGTIKSIEIYSVKGDKFVETQTDQNRFILNAEYYPSGIYIVKVKSAESNWVGKFCKD
jgi:hypothetical protein